MKRVERRTWARRALAWLGALAAIAYAPHAFAHEARPASLEISETTLGRYVLLWRTPLLSGMRLPIALRLPDGVRTVAEPTLRELSDSLLERRVIEVPGGELAGRRIDFVGLQATITDVLVRVQMADGRNATMLVNPSQPWVEIAAAHGPLSVAAAYLLQGIRHIALGVDHLLFVLALLLLVKERWMLLQTVAAFGVAHSLTLAIAALGWVDAPLDALNAAIALGILLLGLEIVRSWRGETSLTIRHPWVVAFLFGLAHGFGFAAAFSAAGLPRHDLPLALASFNAGVELAQLGFVLLIVLLERRFRQLPIRWPTWMAALPGYTVGTLGALWTIQQTAILLGGLR